MLQRRIVSFLNGAQRTIFFPYLLVTLIGLFTNPLPAAASNRACLADRYDEQATVHHVHDGDTIILRGRHKLRIIGLDTPELKRDDHPAEPFAEQARDTLRSILKPGDAIQLRYDIQKTDKYGRKLAHVFLENGSNVAMQLLGKGLANTLILPPNILFADCYATAQQLARTQSLGLWALAEWQPITVDQLIDAEVPRFYLIKGTVSAVQRDRRKHQLQLKENESELSLMIVGKERALFGPFLSRNMKGKKVLVQGWVNRRHGRLQLRLRHPSAIHVLDGKL